MSGWLGEIEKGKSPAISGRTDIDDGQLFDWAESWYRNDAQIGEVFWTDLENDYPELYARYVEAVDRRLDPLKRLLAPAMRSDLPQGFMWELYKASSRILAITGFSE